MAGKRFTRYYGDAAFQAALDDQFARADIATEPGVWITYAIHDPTRPDHIGGEADGLIIYVGESKEFAKRIRKRMRNAGTATRKPTDGIDGACYEMMARGHPPRFTVLERTASAIDALISETNWTKRLRAAGYPLLNQWTEQKFGGLDIDRYTVPHDWLWPITVSDAIGSRVDLVVRDKASGNETVVDLATFPASMRLREIKASLLQSMRESGLQSQVRLHIR
jgi:hypothetical protein